MTTWQILDDSLSKDLSDDFWSDYAFESAVLLVEALSPGEWAALRGAWPQRPPLWQARCAGILPWASVPRQEVADVLLEMARSSNDALSVSACDTLREFEPSQVAPGLTPETVARLRDVARRRPGLEASAILRLLRSLSVPTRGTVAEAVRAVERHPARVQSVVLEAALSLPVPVGKAGREGLAFFWYPVGGPVQNRVARGPTHRVLASLSEPGDITYYPAGPDDFGAVLAPGIPLGRPTVGGPVAAGELISLRAELYGALDDVLDAALLGLPAWGESQKEAARRLRALFYRLAVISLLPAYRALNPAFFAWLDRNGA